MGIRYYAYAFGVDQREQAIMSPRTVVADDPLADAWGLPPGCKNGWTNFQQASSDRDMLYLDKAWRELQIVTRPESDGIAPRPAYAMFEGEVAWRGMCHDGWIRAILPEDVPAVAEDIESVTDDEMRHRLHGAARVGQDPVEGLEYALDFLGRARRFVGRLVDDGRGMVYAIQ